MKAQTARTEPSAPDAGLQLYLRALAHDFNNLLGAILGNAALLETMLPDGSEAAEITVVIQRAAERASELAEHLSRAARLEPPRHEPVNLNSSLSEISVLLRATLPPGVILRTQLAEPLPPVLGDSVELHQLALNLALNARDAIASLPEPRGVIVLATSVEPKGAMLRVRDTGPGIPRELHEQIFQPFFSTREGNDGGRGLGLAIVDRVAKRHGARITLESEPGRGTEFQILFPASR
jgi:two-component system, cell cycle sensor histidine kinase and response regulator CckA